MITRQLNPRKQGDAGLGVAIAWFATHQYTVCLPLTDSQPYDLVVDNGNGLQRVQVKTTTRSKGGIYQVALRTMGGNQSYSTAKLFDRNDSDLLFVVTGAGTCYLIPTKEITVVNSLTLNSAMEKYLVITPL